MANFFTHLGAEHRAFVLKQPVFFVATAAADGRINLSPKGMDCFRVLDPARVGYLDVGGSGNETQAHLSVDGRATLMFCAFDRPALILRIYAKGRATLPQDAGWDDLAAHFDMLPGTRQIFEFDVQSVQTSCGWGVPVMSFDQDRETLSRYHQSITEADRLAKIADRTKSIDGLAVRLQTRIPV